MSRRLGKRINPKIKEWSVNLPKNIEKILVNKMETVVTVKNISNKLEFLKRKSKIYPYPSRNRKRVIVLKDWEILEENS